MTPSEQRFLDTYQFVATSKMRGINAIREELVSAFNGSTDEDVKNHINEAYKITEMILNRLDHEARWSVLGSTEDSLTTPQGNLINTAQSVKGIGDE
jgi:hypothetical protein